MKTTMDAVNEFKGVRLRKSGDEWKLNYPCESGLSNGYKVNGVFVYTREGFNTLLDHLASNMGRATQTYAEYKEAVTKLMRELHAKYVDDTGSCLAPNEFKDKAANIINAEAKPVYTKEMADNGVLPSVGMECLIFNGELHNPEYEKAEIDFIGVHVAVYSSESCTERTCNLELIKFKPIDQRTDKEKAIDEAYKELILASGKSNFKNELGNIYDKWVK